MDGTGLRTHATPAHRTSGAVAVRSLIIGLAAFLTVVDLFATQAILPTLAAMYDVSPAAMGLAVNASTLGMAVAGLAVAYFSRHLDRRAGIVGSLALLAVPTALLAVAPDLPTFAALRVAQGLFMAAAFALTLSYLGEACSAQETAGAFAAYITGNVASNLFGRLMAAALVDHLGVAGNFAAFAALNLAGAALVGWYLRGTMARPMPAGRSPAAVWCALARDPALRAAFALGFCILFAFIGTFTYVNFVLVRAPLALSPMALGFVYFVFAPAIVTTPLAGSVVARLGTRPTLVGALGLAGTGLPLLLVASLPAVLAGLALVGVGTFFAQAVATGFVGRAASLDRGAASGLYLACYFAGGLVGSAVLGRAFDHAGWAACVAGIGAALAVGVALSTRLRLAEPGP